MSARRAIRRIPVGVAVTLMGIGVIGFVVALILNVFVLDRYAAYGEVPIPGSGTVHLPVGEVTVSLHTRVISSPTGGGLPVPPISLGVTSPDGAPDPEFEESIGPTTTVNNDSRRRLWRMQVAVAGDYQITTDGQVGAYIAPRLAFGEHAGRWSLVWIFAGIFGLGLLDLIAARWFAVRGRPRSVRSDGAATESAAETVMESVAGRYVPDDEGIRIEQLKTITALRDSGALTEAEFAEEKRRILRGH
ncbi:SHOCT domain-containing protein [[Mycobacterium] kokjensenii]|uniref:SHOCT domain-containing protein n=1 Tax=[Mycobacterium] kokjensenii TaxID=3064287 RepID=A0ABM9LCF3_9MYCO|nr:SHOCT domain-containing protein [Mycolicibacter sp. MU0083]CAJ1496629.1 SHOCT domain-containing protein [Mycolicibacter sp. MU0083]